MQNILSLALLGLTLLQPIEVINTVDFNVLGKTDPLAEEFLDLTNRYPNIWVNEVFSDNILLALHYLMDPVAAKAMAGRWDKIREPFTVSFELKPGEVFAFHDQVLPEFEGKVVKTMNARFYGDEGFKSDGYLIGDGVCHLASLMNWVAQEAGLKVLARANHDFRPVPGIDREYGTSIFYGNQDQNLYLENSFEYPVKFSFEVDSNRVRLTIAK